MLCTVVKSIDRAIGRVNVPPSSAVVDSTLQKKFLGYARCSIRLTMRSQVSLNGPRRVLIDGRSIVIVFVALGVSIHSSLLGTGL